MNIRRFSFLIPSTISYTIVIECACIQNIFVSCSITAPFAAHCKKGGDVHAHDLDHYSAAAQEHFKEELLMSMLRQKMINDMQLRRLADLTIKSYVNAVHGIDLEIAASVAPKNLPMGLPAAVTIVPDIQNGRNLRLGNRSSQSEAP